MKLINEIYKTSYLSKNGLFLFVSLIILFFSGPVIIPQFHFNSDKRQLFSINGINIKYGDTKQISMFIESIKINDGYLCLGTSESGTIKGSDNYYNYLTNDSSINSRFSVLSGAGRTCGIFIPTLNNNREIVDSLKIIYFINPVYWSADLCKVQKEYWNRYSNYLASSNVVLSELEKKKYYLEVEAYFDVLNIGSKLFQSIEYCLYKIRKYYFQDLLFNFYPNKYKNSLTYVSEKKVNLLSFRNFEKIDTDDIDTTWNIQRTFKNKNWFKPINEETNYRYNELISFITLCRDLKINATFIIGPYNERFITNYDLNKLEGYKKTTQKIKQVLIKEKVQFIDASDISSKAGVFIDHQHHSSYGAFLIYKKIKSFINEKDYN